MKKLSFTIAFIAMNLVCTGTFAQEETNTAIQASQQETVEINLFELPEAIITIVTANFTEHTTAQAFKTIKDKKEVYSVTFTKDNVKEEVLFDADGQVIIQKDIEI